jgi:hypothetical protein
MSSRKPIKPAIDAKIRTKHSDALQRKIVHIAKEGASFYSLAPSWAFSLWDNDHPKRGHVAQSAETVAGIVAHMRTRERQTWGDICKTLGSRNTESHFIEIDRLSKDAQRRIMEIDLSENEALVDGELFSLHITNKLRLW